LWDAETTSPWDAETTSLDTGVAQPSITLLAMCYCAEFGLKLYECTSVRTVEIRMKMDSDFSRPNLQRHSRSSEPTIVTISSRIVSEKMAFSVENSQNFPI